MGLLGSASAEKQAQIWAACSSLDQDHPAWEQGLGCSLTTKPYLLPLCRLACPQIYPPSTPLCHQPTSSISSACVRTSRTLPVLSQCSWWVAQSLWVGSAACDSPKPKPAKPICFTEWLCWLSTRVLHWCNTGLELHSWSHRVQPLSVTLI